MVVTAGFDGYCRHRDGGDWCAVYAVLSNEGPDIEGELRVVAAAAAAAPTVHARRVVLPAHSRKAYFLYLPSAEYASRSRLAVQLVAADTVLSAEQAAVSWLGEGDRLYGVASSNPSALNFLSDVAPPGGRAAVAHLNVETLPPDPLGWRGLDVLVLNDVDTAALSGEQRQALETWVAHGGHLTHGMRNNVSAKMFDTRSYVVSRSTGLLDYDEIVGMCNSQPYCHLLLPGAWVGGGCIPVNPYFLIEAGEYNNSKLRIARLARKVNDQLPSHIIRLVVRSLRDCGKSIRRAKVAVFGASYKADVKNLEYSPVHLLVERLAKKGAEVKVYDPFFTSEELKKAGLPAARGLKGTLEKADVLLITVAHGEFKKLNPRSIARLVKRPAAVIDCGYTLDPRRIEEEGMVFRRIGTGDYKRQEP